MELSNILKEARDKKGLLLREVAALIEVDTAMISKFENGDRNPTRPQILRLAEVLDLDKNKLLTLWLRDRLVNEMKNETVALEALRLAKKKYKELAEN